MKINNNYFNKYLKKNYIFENSPNIAVAVSGGPDSMCLLFLLNIWIKQNNGSLVALIIDHQLRDESNIEAQHIGDYLSKKKILSSIIKINKRNIKKRSMAEARDNRFNSLLDYCKKNNILHLFLGHHLDDDIENFLIRKIAGSNFEGLRGIENKMILKNIRILRPLIDINKTAILAYNNLNKIQYVEDPTNKNTSYTRTLVRNFLLNDPINKKNIKNDFGIIRKNFKFYKKMIFQSFHEVLIKITNKSIFIDCQIFFNKDEIIQSKIIEIVYKYLKSSRGPLRYKKIALFLEKLKNSTGSELNLAGLLIKKYNFIIIFIAK